MQTLTELINDLKPVYEGSTIEVDDYSFELKQSVKKIFPAFLFRGENGVYATTQSGYARKFNQLKKNFNETQFWIMGRDMTTLEMINQNNLIFYIRKRLFNIDITEHDKDDIVYDISISSFMQHYGMDMSFIDFTSALDVAAYFSVYDASPGDQGRLLVQPVHTLPNMIFDLTKEKMPRPQKQFAYAINSPVGFDLKEKSNIIKYDSQWFTFQITDQDIRTFSASGLMDLKDDDDYPALIIEWYHAFIQGNPSVSKEVDDYFKKKVDFFAKCRV